MLDRLRLTLLFKLIWILPLLLRSAEKWVDLRLWLLPRLDYFIEESADQAVTLLGDLSNNSLRYRISEWIYFLDWLGCSLFPF